MSRFLRGRLWVGGVLCAWLAWMPLDSGAADSVPVAPDEEDPWYDSQGWPGSRSVNRQHGRTWWDTEVSEWPPWERGILRGGAMITSFDTSLSLTLQGKVGLAIDAEQLLGLDSNLGVSRVDGLWRFGKRKRNTLDFTLSNYHRSATTVSRRELDLGIGEPIPIGSTLRSVFDFDLYRLTYSYMFFQDKRLNLGAGLGVYVAPIKYGLSYTPLNGSTVGFDTQDVTLPLPALALRGQYRITPRFYLLTELDVMYLEIDQFRGKLFDLRFALEYQIWRYFGLGLGYNVFDIDVSASDEANYVGEFVGNVNVHFSGLLMYGKLSF